MVFEPKPLPLLPFFQISRGGSTPGCCSREHRAPSFPSSEPEGFLRVGAGLQHFSSSPSCLLLRRLSWASVVQRWKPLTCTQLPLMEWRLYLGHGVLKILGPQKPFSWLMKQWFQARRVKPRDLRLLSPSQPEGPAPKRGCHSERSLP